ncbi:hypothetical protein FRC06_006245, partial [Ceratobasidium sp. 370]
MSSRGRKRNDNLPPSRAREVQRAFRARRKQHLAALEERIDVLETENARLRQMLALPPSDRQPLGRGPTGREPARRVSTPGASGSTSGPTTAPTIGIDLAVDPGADPVPAASPPPLSPGQPVRSPSAGAWPPPLQPPADWPLNHPPGPGSAVRAPSPYSHLGTYGSFYTIPRPASERSRHATEGLRQAAEGDPGTYNSTSNPHVVLPTSLPIPEGYTEALPPWTLDAEAWWILPPVPLPWQTKELPKGAIDPFEAEKYRDLQATYTGG